VHVLHARRWTVKRDKGQRADLWWLWRRCCWRFLTGEWLGRWWAFLPFLHCVFPYSVLLCFSFLLLFLTVLFPLAVVLLLFGNFDGAVGVLLQLLLLLVLLLLLGWRRWWCRWQRWCGSWCCCSCCSSPGVAAAAGFPLQVALVSRWLAVVVRPLLCCVLRGFFPVVVPLLLAVLMCLYFPPFVSKLPRFLPFSFSISFPLFPSSHSSFLCFKTSLPF